MFRKKTTMDNFIIFVALYQIYIQDILNKEKKKRNEKEKTKFMLINFGRQSKRERGKKKKKKSDNIIF